MARTPATTIQEYFAEALSWRDQSDTHDEQK